MEIYRVKQIYRLFRGTINSFSYVVYFTFVLCFSLFAVPISLLALPFGKQQVLLHGAMQKSLYAFTFGFLQKLTVVKVVSITGKENIPTGKAVFVANHQSWLDGLLLLGLLPGSTPVMKGAYARNGFYRQFVRWTKFISIDRGSTASMSLALEQSYEVLSRDKRVLVFPEGTRSSNGRVHSFNPFAFKIAAQSQSPIVPITITYTPLFMTKSFASFYPATTVDITITIHKSLVSSGATEHQLSSDARKIIQRSLKERNG